jgi:hypothetical protein
MSARPHDQPMPESEHAQLRSYLQSKGMTAAQIQSVVGNAAGGRQRSAVEQALTTWLKNRPKG